VFFYFSRSLCLGTLRLVRILWATIALLVGLLTADAENFNLTTGDTLVGELLPTSANDIGIQIKVGENDYKRVSWATFSQEDLKKMAQNAKLQPYVEPFIEVTVEERIQRTEVKTVPPPRLDLPPKRNLLIAMFTSVVGIFILLVLYAANLYAAYEISIYRTQPAAVVCGAAAVLPLIGPLAFLIIPSKIKGGLQEPIEGGAPASEGVSPAATDSSGSASLASRATSAPSGSAPAVVEEDDDNPMHVAGAQHPGLHLAHEEHKPKHAPAAIYKRGEFTFNRRFFETRFPGFFGTVRRDADKDMVLVIKSFRGEYIGNRISRIASNDLHLQMERGGASQEVMIPFTEIQEIHHKHKDAP
jgi:hypothetical protein